MAALLTWDGTPPVLDRPVLVVALDGFVDAGLAASTASTFLRHRWQADLCATFSRDAFVDYRARRPTAVVDSGELRRLEWPSIELYAARVEGPHDAALLLGAEPDMRWGEFCGAVVDACRALGVEAAVTVGAYPAAVPHTRPTRITGAATAVPGGLEFDASPIPGYTGPVGVGTALQSALAEAGIPAAGLWAEVPHYISGSPNPAAALALVQMVGAGIGTAVDTTELEAAAKLHREQIDDAVADHEDAAIMVTALERHFDSGEAEESLPSGDEMAAEIERFLRMQSE
jgi:predicted ATP-grasp superfamily ATP-dependent carboligase